MAEFSSADLPNFSISHDLLSDNTANERFPTLQEEYLANRCYRKRKNATHALSEADEEFLWDSGHLGKHSAQALVNVNFKNVTEHFGLREREEHYSMMVKDVYILTSPDSSVKYVTFREGPARARQGGIRIVQRAVKPKMFATGGERCPVMLFEEMISRRPPELKTHGPFYLTTIP